MIIEKEKPRCIESIYAAITKTGDWRGKLAVQYPEDTRNKRAEAKLARLADQASSLSDHHWEALKPFFNGHPTRWRECLSQATRQIGFIHKTTSFPFFVRNLIGFLQTEKV
jgi:hypothetical protein